MDLHQYTKKLNKTKTLRSLSNILIFVGIIGCVNTLYLSTLDKAPFWPLITVFAGAILFIVSQCILEPKNED